MTAKYDYQECCGADHRHHSNEYRREWKWQLATELNTSDHKKERESH